MGNGIHEWPLILFTVLGQCVVGGIIVSGLAWFSTDNRQQKQSIVKPMIVLWILMGLGFIASMTHMGSPFRAFNSMNRLFSSSLSNEVMSGAVFFAVGGFWWLLSVLNKLPAALSKIGLIVTMLLGVLFVWAMTRVYMINTVPTWNTPYTTFNFFLTVFIAGPILATLLLKMANFSFNSSKLAWISVIAVIVSVAVVMLQSGQIAEISSSVQKAQDLVPDYAYLQVVRLALICIGLCLWIAPMTRGSQPTIISLLLGSLLIFVGEFIGRGLFYGLHMTVGMAVA